MWISLLSIYTKKEIMDEGEAIFSFIPEDFENLEFAIIEKSSEDLKKLREITGEIPILIAYKLNAKEEQQQLVESYRKRIRANRDVGPILLCENRIIDGNHRTVAAILEEKNLKTIDINIYREKND